ncbi:guanine deaminase [Prevotella disiens JCM 6334 = ATCC 29426]|uniref:Guanine deaminase n=4 Tax=Prevotella disiens TaxID=28130 RepID=A0A096AU64_9BACT|nr:nucleoside deaminase [Prevotella disiens]EFL45572.1 cytidine and deoxycytidylate deaminase zinc-binding region [Prevotella disiens FB035-09AN]ERJ78704.1 guanine deaminase [Prevotella disiens JCM 6334 = ATCC 29426]KGF50633.1 guanine deaminase [Prevotella disiens DNF00882]SUB85345.1 Guanine deaminase [Prevotella disiens]
MTNEELMRRAIELSENSVRNGGGPFGAVIAKDGEIIAEGSNRVTIDNDPTAHAEVCTIRKACEKLGTFDLKGCVIYTSCEPCPMCFGAIYWAHLEKIYYANDRKDAGKIGFDDDFIYEEIAIEPQYRKKPSEIILQNEAINAFKMWTLKDDKSEY